MAQNEARVLTPAERAINFNKATRQHLITLPSRALPANGTVEFEIPKVRLTSRLFLMVEGAVTIGGTGIAPLRAFSPVRFLRNIRLSINNGFNPFQISGRGLFLLNHLNNLGIGESVNALNSMENSRGVANHFRIFLEMPLTLNQRDAIGLINTANPQTVVNLTIDTDSLESLFSGAETGLSSALTITPMVESFSISRDPNAIPDLSVLKLVHEFSQVIPASGDITFEMQTGLTYRKFVALYEDASGAGLPVSALTSDLQIIFNQADFPYIVRPQILRNINQKAYGRVMPEGVYVFDFSSGGFPNFGGSRDYVKTETLTEFWLRTSVNTSGRLTVLTETLARLS